RVKVIAGDLAREQLGLEDNVYQELAEEVDAIYHNGAWVHHFYHYDALKSANVDSTISLLKLSSTSKTKVLHYFSTLSAHLPNYKEEALRETFPKSDPSAYNLSSGYEQTKWVSECLLAEAHKRGFLINIFRLG